MAAGEQPKVLIADDDRELARTLVLRCRSLGLDAIAAHDSLAALLAVDRFAPDVVCLDVCMPAGNGLSVCEMLASEPAWKSIPVVILTGREDPETIKRCHHLCAYYVPKCADIWSRIKPLLHELLDLTS